MTPASTVSEINGMMTELAYKFANLVDNDPKAEELKNELSRLNLLRYQLLQDATATNNKRDS